MDYLHFGKEGGEKLVVLPGLALRSVMVSAEAIVSAYEPLAKTESSGCKPPDTSLTRWAANFSSTRDTATPSTTRRRIT